MVGEFSLELTNSPLCDVRMQTISAPRVTRLPAQSFLAFLRSDTTVSMDFIPGLLGWPQILRRSRYRC
jgi:hypothetical protein